jgi:hypothetical protein
LKFCLGVRTQEHAILCDSVFLCPVPVKLDGRLLNEPEKVSRLLQVALGPYGFGPLRSTFILCERLLVGADGTGEFLVTNPAQRTYLTLSAAGERLDCGLENPSFSPDPWRGLGLVLDWHQAGARLVERKRADRGGAYVLSTRLEVMPGGRKRQARDWNRFLGVEPTPPVGFLNLASLDPSYEAQPHPLVRAALYLVAGDSGTGGLYLVRHGVVTDFKSVDLGARGAVAVVAADHLRTDLSFLRVVEDEAFASLVRGLREHYRQMQELVIASLDRLLPAGEDVVRYVGARIA